MNNTTFNINILTPGKNKNKYPSSYKILLIFLPVAAWLILGLGLYFYLYLPTYREIQRQKQVLQTLDIELAQVKALHRKVEIQNELFFMVAEESINWSPKLIYLSLLIPQDLWINKLSFNKTQKSKEQICLLDIYGQIFSTSHRESLDKIATFIEEINKTPSFNNEFLPVEFIYSQLEDDKNQIMDFKLSAGAKSAIPKSTQANSGKKRNTDKTRGSK